MLNVKQDALNLRTEALGKMNLQNLKLKKTQSNEKN